MAITRTTAEERKERQDRTAQADDRRRTERWLLGAVSVLVLTGLFLTVRGQFTSIPDARDAVNLNRLTNAEALVPHLTAFEDPDDRRFAARRIAAFLADGHAFSDLAALRTLRVSASDIASTDGLTVYRQRLDAAQRVWQRTDTPPDRRTLSLLTASQLARMSDGLIVRTPGSFERTFWAWVLVYLAAFYAIHAAWTFRRFRGDPLLLPLLHLLTGIGLMMMVSLRDPLRDGLLFSGYIVGVVAGAVGLWLLSRVDFRRSVWRRLAYVPLLLSFLLSIVLVVFGSGPAGTEARINLHVLGVSVQPVEVIKVLLVLFFAGYFADRWEFLREVHESDARFRRLLVRIGGERGGAWADRWAALVRRLHIPRLEYVAPVVVAVGLTLLFFFFQKDLGPALIIACLFVALYGVARGRWTATLVGLAAVVAVFWLSYRIGYPATVVGRIQIWLSPWVNEVAYGGNHLAHSFWALASGGFFGTGAGLGAPALVPQAHTDFVIAAIGEELGFVGLAAVLGAYGLLLHRAFVIARRAPSVYTFFLALGVMLLTAFQVILIGGGVLGVLPLSGVISPFLNAGKSSMIANMALFGMLAAVSSEHPASASAAPLRRSARVVMLVVGGFLVVLAGKAAWIQVVHPVDTMVRGARTVEADGVQRVRYNPRLLAAARMIPRGTIYDRRGIPLATSDPEELAAHADVYAQLGVSPDLDAARAGARVYPFGDLTFHLLGDVATRRNMAAENTSYVEKDERVQLRGYDDLRELVPLWRHRYRPEHPAVRALLAQDRDVHLTVDVRLQQRVAEALERRIRAAGLQKGAAVVLDPQTGAVLASATYPDDPADGVGLLDRPRYGVYPPGSTFKLVTAVAALRKGERAAEQTYTCRALPGGGVGAHIDGWGRAIHDASSVPHGTLDMERALTVSCNAYFAQLGTYFVGAEDLFHTLKAFGMDAGMPGTPDSLQLARLRDALPQAAIGQGPVLARPIEMARVSATIANQGRMPLVHVVQPTDSLLFMPETMLDPGRADRLAAYMRDVVTSGTGQALRDLEVPAAGKTGTAEVQGARSHAWFTGFAPYGPEPRIAFAVVVEHGGAGGRIAAGISGDLVQAASELGMFSASAETP